MSKWFPEMYDRPDNGPVAASAVYWVICYFMIPFVTLVLSWAFSYDLGAVIGVDIVTYFINFLCITGLFRTYLADSFESAMFDKASFIKTVLLAAILMLLIEGGLLIFGSFKMWNSILWAYPISETSVVATTLFVVLGNPLIGTLCMTILTPATVSCMFYGTVFAPIACSRPKLAHAVTAVALLLPRLLSIWWTHTGTFDFFLYLLQLPIHFIACWSYQKSNTIWAPIASLGISNLLVCLLILHFGAVGIIS